MLVSFILCATLICVSTPVLAESAASAVSTPASKAANSVYSNDVNLIAEGGTLERPEQTFVVTHGLGGTSHGDRFEMLAHLLKQEFPNANVYRIDWTRPATAEMFGLPIPWQVAKRIDGVAAVAAAELRQAGIDPHQTTLIGESFGDYVNCGIARELGGVKTILAFNPANELGGYEPPDIRGLAVQSVTFISFSDCDTHRKIAQRTLLLDTPDISDPFAQHRYGIQWLCHTLEQHDDSWVKMEHAIPQAEDSRFDGTVLADGSLDARQPLIVRSVSNKEVFAAR
jgi:hypothetical protein